MENNLIKAAESALKLALHSKTAALKNFLGSEDKALKFASAVLQAVQQNPKLLECTQDSLMGAFMQCASLGFFPTNYSGDCYVLPYRTKDGMMAQFQIGYRGFKTLAFRSGISRCGTEVVFENDTFKEELGTIQKLTHIPSVEADRGRAIGAYAWAEVTPGNIVFKFMREADVMKIKATSKAKDASFSPWNSNDPMLWMWQKTAFKQLAKLLPTSDELERAVRLDNVSERGGYIKDESTVVEQSFDDSVDVVEVGKAKKEALRQKNLAQPEYE